MVKLDAIKSYRTFKAGETITWAGDEMSFVGSVIYGVATLTRTMVDGRRQMVGLLLPSDFVGRPGRATAPYDVTAASELKLCMFRKPSFDKLIADTPALEHRLLDMTLDELDSAREWMLLLGRKTAREKIASFLAMIGRREAAILQREAGADLHFALPLTRESIADYLGLTIETVSRQMTALKKDGIIRLEDARHIHVPDFALLLDESGEDSDGGVIA